MIIWHGHSRPLVTGKHKHTSADDLNLDGLLGRLVETALVVLGSLDGGGEEGVDESSLSETRLA